MIELPIITDCEGCGACCMEQSSPPGYLYVLGSPNEDHSNGPFADDAKRIATLPKRARAALDGYLKKILRGDFDGMGDFPCCWLDLKTRKCRWYEHRPSVCRDELQVGDEGCRRWRNYYHDGNGASGRLRRLLAMFRHRRDK